MTTFKIADARMAVAYLICSLVAFPALAQQSTTPATQSQLTVERIKNSVLIAPDFKVTDIDDNFSKLAGVYGGWLMDKKLLVGGGGYWLTNRSNARKMAYGGLMVGWLEGADRRIGFGVKGLVGLGQATLATSLSASPQTAVEFRDRRIRATVPALRMPDRPVRLIFDDDFFIAEPQANVLVKITSWLRLDGGVGYRVVGGARGAGERLHGMTGNLAFQVGVGS